MLKLDNKFLRLLADKENRCRNLQRQANNLFIQQDRKFSDEQCVLLQQAADLESEMASITSGSERQHHINEKNRLDSDIRTIRINLDSVSNSGSSSKANGESPKEKKYMTNSDGNEKSKEEAELDRAVNTWYKDAPTHSFEDVAGMHELKAKLKSCIVDAKAQELRDFLKIPKLNSYFFVGPPGCGKTYIIEAFAHELMDKDYKFISLQGSDIISRYVGVAEKSVTRLFEEAIKNEPCIIFIDEIDSLCKNRSLPNLPEYAANITTSFLTGYNRIHSIDSNVIFIAATNYPNRVDTAMLDRAEIVRVPLPDLDARSATFERYFDGIIKLKKGFTYNDMATLTKRFNHRDIERLVSVIKNDTFKKVLEISKDQQIAIKMLKEGKYSLTRKKFEEVLSKFVPSPKDGIIADLKAWEKSVRAFTDENPDFDINKLYESEAPSEVSEKSAVVLEDNNDDELEQEATVEEERPEPVYPLQDEFSVENGCVEVIFKTKQKFGDISAFIDDDYLEITKVDGEDRCYKFVYTPYEDDEEIIVFVKSENEFVGDFCFKVVR